MHFFNIMTGNIQKYYEDTVKNEESISKVELKREISKQKPTTLLI